MVLQLFKKQFMNDKAKANSWKIVAKEKSDILHAMTAQLGVSDDELREGIKAVGGDPDDLRKYFIMNGSKENLPAMKCKVRIGPF